MDTLSILRGGGIMKTKIESIVKRACKNNKEKFTALMHHFSKENLQECFDSLKRTKAVGVDGITKLDYQKDIDINLENLVESLKNISYRPKPVRRVEILKEDGSSRPIGISCTEDKIIQEMSRQVLEAIYEPVFSETSYGFRPNRSCHDALRRLNAEVMKKPVNWIVDMDISKFFDSMPHKEILTMLEERIGDKKFLRLVSRLLKVGIQFPNGVVYDELGSPQGSVVSPVIANVFLDKVLDKWFEEILKPYFSGYCEFIRYADDGIAFFEKEEDALKFLKVLPLRLAKFGLELNLGKTKLVKIGKVEAYQKELLGKRMPTFDFLGFTHYWGKSNTGKLRLKRKTSKKRFRRALVSLNEWLKEQRNRLTLQQLWKIISSKIRGHYNYFGVTDNIHTLQRFEYEAKRLIFARIKRRSQRKSFTWKEFNGYLKIFPLPKPKISVNLGW